MRTWTRCTLTLLAPCWACATPGSMLTAHRDASPVTIELEGGALSQSRNDVRIPGEGGTRFSLSDLAGEGAFPVGRVTVDWEVGGPHALRAVLAPIEFDGSGSLATTTQFAGETFAPDQRTNGRYKFSSWRLGYRYTLRHVERWRLRIGGTLFVRDAKVELTQGTTRASDSDIGVVPLLNFGVEYAPSRNWRIVGEVDGLAASQGRAFDASLKAHYDVSDRTSVSLGYRTIEGGADNADVFNFAWLQAVVASVSVRL